MKLAEFEFPQSARTMIRLGVSFGVGFAVAMAPLIGAKEIPFFRPLADLLSESHRNVLIPVSALLLGLIAMSVHFLLGEKVSRARIRKTFVATLIAIGVSVVALVTLHQLYIVKAGCSAEPIVLGWSRLESCGCEPGSSDRTCLEDSACQIEGCWKESQARQVTLSIYLSYLFILCGFEVLVGLLTLQESARAIARRRGRANARKKPRKKSTPAGPAPENAAPTAPP